MKRERKVREQARQAKRATSHRSPSRLRRQERRRKAREDAQLDTRAAKSGLVVARSFLEAPKKK